MRNVHDKQELLEQFLAGGHWTSGTVSGLRGLGHSVLELTESVEYSDLAILFDCLSALFATMNELTELGVYVNIESMYPLQGEVLDAGGVVDGQ